MLLLWAGVAGLLFGAGSQYLGNLNVVVALGWWSVSVSQMSSLWLLLPSAVGCTQDRPRRAMAAGLVATIAAFAGSCLMLVGPLEGVPPSRIPHAAAAWLASNILWLGGGLVTGPLFGLLGHRWRVHRSLMAAALVSGAFLLEPLARLLDTRLVGPGWIWAAEAGFGALLGASLLVVAARGRSPARAI